MGKFVFTDGYVTVGGTDLSALCDEIGLEIDADSLSATTFNAAGWKDNEAGLKGGSLSLSFKQDFALTSVDATIWAAFIAGTAAIEVRPTTAARSATNPGFTFSVAVTQYKPISNKVGEMAEHKVQWPISGAVARATV